MNEQASPVFGPAAQQTVIPMQGSIPQQRYAGTYTDSLYGEVNAQGTVNVLDAARQREVLQLEPARLVITALTEAEVREGIDTLRPIAGGTELASEWGNLFTPAAIKHASRDTVLDDRADRVGDLGIGKGDPVAIMAVNRTAHTLADYGAMTAAAVEGDSEHPVARAIVRSADERNLTNTPARYDSAPTWSPKDPRSTSSSW